MGHMAEATAQRTIKRCGLLDFEAINHTGIASLSSLLQRWLTEQSAPAEPEESY